MKNEKNKEIEIMGYFKRSKDGNEYILYKQKGKLFITSGVNIWNDQFGRITKRYLPQLEEADQINIKKMAKRLRESYKFEKITVEVLRILSEFTEYEEEENEKN